MNRIIRVLGGLRTKLWYIAYKQSRALPEELVPFSFRYRFWSKAERILLGACGEPPF